MAVGPRRPAVDSNWDCRVRPLTFDELGKERCVRRNDLLPGLGIQPTVHGLVHAALADAIRAAEARSPGSVRVLDAGCGRKSPLVRFRPRIAHLVGVDLHQPAPPLPWVDDFAIVDLCRPEARIPGDGFDIVLSNFTLEHFVDPDMALANFMRWIRPSGTVILTTVNRRHPFVAAYLGLPDGTRRRLQPVLKASAADAHPLVGACNDPAAIRQALRQVGFIGVHLETVPNLARSWSRHRATFALGVVGDLLAQSIPSRRSTILAIGHAPPI
jgi:SAM-dependent methyltransferase